MREFFLLLAEKYISGSVKDGTVGIPFDYNGVVSLLYNRRYVAMVSRSSGYEATDPIIDY